MYSIYSNVSFTFHFSKLLFDLYTIYLSIFVLFAVCKLTLLNRVGIFEVQSPVLIAMTELNTCIRWQPLISL